MLSIGSELDVAEVLQRIIEVATELVDARNGALGVLDEAGTRLAQFITVGIDDEERRQRGPVVSLSGRGLGSAVRHGEPAQNRRATLGPGWPG